MPQTHTKLYYPPLKTFSGHDVVILEVVDVLVVIVVVTDVAVKYEEEEKASVRS